MLTRLPLLVATASVLLGTVACQQYERRSLDLEDHLQAWGQRDPQIASVGEYAEALRAGRSDDSSSFDLTDGVSLHEAEAVALHFNADLRLLRAQAEVPLAAAREAGWWPDPEFEAEVLRFAERGNRSRLRFQGPSLDGLNAGGAEVAPAGLRRADGDFIDDPWILGASLSITIPLSGRLLVEQDWAWATYDAAWREVVVAEWELLNRLHAAWLEWSAGRQRVDLSREYVERLRRVTDRAETLASAGELQPTEVRVLRIELARRQLALQALEAHESQQHLALLALLGLAPQAPVSLQPALVVPQLTTEPAARSQALLTGHPRLAAVRADYETAEQRLRLEIREQLPDLTLGPAYSLEEGFSRIGLGFGFPIPLWNRNRQAIAEAVAAREAARVHAEAVLERVSAELTAAEARQSAAQTQRSALTQDVAPLVDRQVEDARRLLELGEVDILVLREALSASFETKLEILDTLLAEALAADALQQMVEPRWGGRAPVGRQEPKR